MPNIQTDPSFVFQPHPPPIAATGTFPGGVGPPTPTPPGPSDGPQPVVALPPPVDALVGTWIGTGFNAIWRPHFPDAPQDRFLELNPTQETIVFTAINGRIPNRGLLQGDISMFGVTYIQQISDSSDQSGLHVEPGIWAVVPQTIDPALPPTIVRMASIPHGTTILAQGTVGTSVGRPTIPDIDIIPFGLNGGPPIKTTFAQAEQTFPELNLAINTQFRQTADTVAQGTIENPNSLLQDRIASQNITSTTTLAIATNDTPVPGGGTANTAFLQGGAANAAQPNANATLMTATFWIETLTNPDGTTSLQLQYSQEVMLDFNSLRWPHVSIATLTKQ